MAKEGMKVNPTLNPAVATKIKDLADAERRSVANTVEILLEWAVTLLNDPCWIGTKPNNLTEVVQYMDARRGQNKDQDEMLQCIMNDFAISMPAVNVRGYPEYVRSRGVGHCHELHAHETIGTLLKMLKEKL